MEGSRPRGDSTTTRKVSDGVDKEAHVLVLRCAAAQLGHPGRRHGPGALFRARPFGSMCVVLSGRGGLWLNCYHCDCERLWTSRRFHDDARNRSERWHGQRDTRFGSSLCCCPVGQSWAPSWALYVISSKTFGSMCVVLCGEGEWLNSYHCDCGRL